MKLKVGDKVRIKSLDWYNANKDGLGNVRCKNMNRVIMTKSKSKWCGQIMTICHSSWGYTMVEDEGKYLWIDDLFECKVEDTNERNQVLGAKLEVIREIQSLIAQTGASEVSLDDIKSKEGTLLTLTSTDVVRLVNVWKIKEMKLEDICPYGLCKIKERLEEVCAKIRWGFRD